MAGLEGDGVLLRGAEVEGGPVCGLGGFLLAGPEGGSAAHGGLVGGGVLLHCAEVEVGQVRGLEGGVLLIAEQEASRMVALYWRDLPRPALAQVAVG